MPHETDLVQSILLALGCRPDLRVWRQNTGVAWQPTTTDARAAFARLRSRGGFRPVQYGTPGTSDVVGIVHGRFIGIEAKSATGQQSEEQQRWAAMVVKHGGLYILARSVDDAVEGVDRAIT